MRKEILRTALAGAATALAIAGLSAFAVQAQESTAPSMAVGAVTSAPPGFLDFCARMPAQCGLDGARDEQGQPLSELALRRQLYNRYYWAAAFSATSQAEASSPPASGTSSAATNRPWGARRYNWNAIFGVDHIAPPTAPGAAGASLGQLDRPAAGSTTNDAAQNDAAQNNQASLTPDVDASPSAASIASSASGPTGIALLAPAWAASPVDEGGLDAPWNANGRFTAPDLTEADTDWASSLVLTAAPAGAGVLLREDVLQTPGAPAPVVSIRLGSVLTAGLSIDCPACNTSIAALGGAWSTPSTNSDAPAYASVVAPGDTVIFPTDQAVMPTTANPNLAYDAPAYASQALAPATTALASQTSLAASPGVGASYDAPAYAQSTAGAPSTALAASSMFSGSPDATSAAPGVLDANLQTLPATRALLAELDRVNLYVNGAIRYVSDRTLYGDEDYWHLSLGPGGAGAGDCKDYVLEKRRALIADGIPSAALSIAIVETRWRESHAVLLVRTDRGELVLDSLSSWVQPWWKVHYRWVKRQAPGQQLTWVSLI